jgi:hypothetical protein
LNGGLQSCGRAVCTGRVFGLWRELCAAGPALELVPAPVRADPPRHRVRMAGEDVRHCWLGNSGSATAAGTVVDVEVILAPPCITSLLILHTRYTWGGVRMTLTSTARPELRGGGDGAVGGAVRLRTAGQY